MPITEQTITDPRTVSTAFAANDFIRKWRAVELKERSAAQEHFLDLCRLVGEPTPAEADPIGDFYCFERGATKASGGEGWADVWKRDHFGWEYKGKRKDLDAAFGQLQQYALALESPPLLVVSDLDRFIIRTAWSSTVSEKHEFALDDLRDPLNVQKLKMGDVRPRKAPPRQDAPRPNRRCCRGVRGAGAESAVARTRSHGGCSLHQPPSLLHVRARLRPPSVENVHAHDGGG